MFENAWWGGCIPTSLLDPPLPARISMSPTTTLTNRFGFSMICGKFCHSCVEITARTAIAQFGHSILKTKVRFEKGGGFDPPNPSPGCATDVTIQTILHATSLSCLLTRHENSVSLYPNSNVLIANTIVNQCYYVFCRIAMLVEKKKNTRVMLSQNFCRKFDYSCLVNLLNS